MGAGWKKEVRVLAAIVVAGCALRISGLDVHSLWYDEGTTLASALADDPVAVLRLDRHPPVAFYIVRFWTRWFGESDSAIRLPFALSSCAALTLFTWLSRTWASERARLGAVALFAVAPFQLWHGQEARFYALLELAALIVLSGIELWRSGRCATGCVVSAVGQALALGTHYMGGLLLFTVGAIALAAMRMRVSNVRRAIALIASVFLGAVLWLPWAIAMLPAQLHTVWTYIVQTSASDLIKFPARQLLVEPAALPPAWLGFFDALAILLSLGFVAAAVVAVLRRELRQSFVALAFFAPVSAGFIAALTLGTGFHPKYLIVSAPSATWMAVEGLALIRRAFVRRAALALAVVGCLTVTLVQRAGNHREDYRGACAEVAASWREGDRLVCITGTPDIFGWPLPRHYLRDRPDILATRILEDALARMLAERSVRRLQVIFRAESCSQPHMTMVERNCEIVDRGERRVRVEHSIWAPRARI